MKEKTPSGGVALDLVKVFDMVPYELVFDLFAHLGLPETMVRPLRGFYREVECRFAMGTTLGKRFRKTAGVFQGDPMSMIKVVGLTAVLAVAPANRLAGHFHDTYGQAKVASTWGPEIIRN